jgi:hypothetical protein
MDFHEPSCQAGRLFFIGMKKIFHLLAAVVVLALHGCASNTGVYEDEEEYSSMPWATPEQWEAGPAIPGLSGSGY